MISVHPFPGKGALPPGGSEPPMELTERVANLEKNVTELRIDVAAIKQRLDSEMPQLATKADLFAVKADVQTGLLTVKADMQADLLMVKAGMQADLLTVKADMQADLFAVKADMQADLLALKVDMHKEFNAQTWKIMGLIVTLVIGLFGLTRAFPPKVDIPPIQIQYVPQPSTTYTPSPSSSIPLPAQPQKIK